MKIITILGARPQFIKASAVSRAINIQKNKGIEIEEIIIHTGQHYNSNMSDVFFDEMKIPKPKYYLGIKEKSHGSMTGKMITKIEKILVKEKPGWVIVYGDTNSTLAGAIAASKLNIRIAHVEAGLRSFNNQMPEEINRIITDRLSSLLFCPTQTAQQNLKNEGIKNWKNGSKILLPGDVMLDNVFFYKNTIMKNKIARVANNYVLCTIHRAENTDNLKNLSNILKALIEIAKRKQVIIPLHPRTHKILKNLKLDLRNLNIIKPVGYLKMLRLIDNAALIMTDSGGLQKEAYFFSKPCITLRNETEWIELVKIKVNVLVGSNKDKIIKAHNNYSKFKVNKVLFKLYGGGKASEKIVKQLIKDEK